MGFSVGFSDELEKLALRLPSMGEMTSGLGPSTPPTAPAPEAAAPQQQVHVHVHPQGGGKAGGSKPKASAALPKPPQDAPSPAKHSTEPEFLPSKPGGYQTSAEVGNQTVMPKEPPFSGGTQRPAHSYSGQMKSYVDEGTGPTKQHFFNPGALLGDSRKFDAAPVTNITTGDVLNGSTGGERNPMAGLVEGKNPGLSGARRGAVAGPGSSETAPAKGGPPAPGLARQMMHQPASAGAQSFEMQQIPATPKPKKKMFGTALASNDEPAKI